MLVKARRKRSIVAVLCVAMLNTIGCGIVPEASPPDGPAVAIEVPLLEDQCGVTSAEAEVSASDMNPMGPFALDVSGNSISGLIQGVPAGAAREVAVSAFNAMQLVVYSGTTYVDVARDSVTPAEVTLSRDWGNCPAEGSGTGGAGGTGNIDLIGMLSNDAALTQLDFRVVDAEYSDALEVVVAVGANPSELRLLDPETTAAPSIALSLAPTAVSVSPDGLYAAVGHDAWVSYVNLSTKEVEQVLPVSTVAIDIVLTGDGWVHVFPLRDQWERVRSIELATGDESLHTGNSIRAGSLARLHPTQPAIYVADNGLSPSDIEKYDVAAGPATYAYDSPYHGDFAMCGNLWISQDGSRIYTRCGNTFRASPIQAEDMAYAGALPDVVLIETLDHTSASDLVAMVPGTDFRGEGPDHELRFFDHEFLQFMGATDLPEYHTGDQSYPTHGRFVFFSSDGSSVYTLAQVDASAGLLNDWALIGMKLP
jgi:hypothetical protein